MRVMALLSLFLVLLAAMDAALAADPTVVEGAGIDATTEAFNRFKALLGGEDNGDDEGPLNGGFRRINWDGAMVPLDMPGTFFRDNVTRGTVLSVIGDEFRVSDPILETEPGFGDTLFDTFNVDYPNQFQAFSEPRLFSPLTDYTFTEEFFIPGTGDDFPALIAGYGVVFVDVDDEEDTSMEFFDVNGKSLGKYFVLASPQKLSFLGVYFGDAVIAKVEVNLGDALLGADDITDKGDVVVMDDFLYSEPVAIEKEP